MVNLGWDRAFKRKYKKVFTLKTELKKLLGSRDRFFQNPFDSKLAKRGYPPFS